MKSIKNYGSTFDSFLREEGIFDVVDKLAQERLRAWLSASGQPDRLTAAKRTPPARFDPSS